MMKGIRLRHVVVLLTLKTNECFKRLVLFVVSVINSWMSVAEVLSFIWLHFPGSSFLALPRLIRDQVRIFHVLDATYFAQFTAEIQILKELGHWSSSNSISPSFIGMASWFVTFTGVMRVCLEGCGLSLSQIGSTVRFSDLWIDG